jgi:hypothetical protein
VDVNGKIIRDARQIFVGLTAVPTADIGGS